MIKTKNMNNRKRTKGRRIQEIEVPSMVYEKTTSYMIATGKHPKLIPNPHPNAGSTIYVKHLPTPTQPPINPNS